MKHVKIKVKLEPGATMPTRATDGSVGYDVTALSAVLVDLNGNRVTFTAYTSLDRDVYVSGFCGSAERIRSQYKRVIIDTGVHVTPANGYYVELVPNSRLAKTGLVYGNSLGVIDPDYTGSIKCVLNITSSATPDDLETVSAGRVIGQLIIRKKYDAIFEQVDELEETERGDGGFGSTEKGKNRKEQKTPRRYPSLEDVYTYEAEHSGFQEGDSVLVEGNVVKVYPNEGHAKNLLNVTINGHCGIVVPASKVYHMEEGDA